MKNIRSAILLWSLACCACSPLAPPDNDNSDSVIDPANDSDAFVVSLVGEVVIPVGEVLEIEAVVEDRMDDARLFFTWSYSLDLSGDSDSEPIDESLGGKDSVLILNPRDLFSREEITFLLEVEVLRLAGDTAERASARIVVTIGDAPTTTAGDGLSVSLGGPLSGDPGDVFDLEAVVDGANADGRLFFSWDYLLNADAGGQTLDSTGFERDLDTFVLDPASVFRAADLAEGVTFAVRVRVLEITANGSRDASNTIVVSIGPGLLGDDDDDDTTDAGNDNGTDGNDNDNSGDDPDGNSNDNDNGGVVGGGGGNSNDNDNDNSGDVDVDPCDNTTGFTIVLPDVIHMSLFQGSTILQPTVCAGTPPFSYNWTPVTYLSDNGPLESSPSVITTADVDFTPPVAGQYTVSVFVSDSVTSSTTKSVAIHVNSFGPVVVDAGSDRVVSQGDALSITAIASGGSGNYSYAWSPGSGTSATISPSTGSVGDTTYTLTVTDNQTGVSGSDSVRVVVLAAGSSACTSQDVNLSIATAQAVAYDPAYGTRGQALVVKGKTVVLYDLALDAVRANLVLPTDAGALLIDAANRRAYATTRISGQFTRSVQIINLDSATLGTNVALTANVATAGGMALIPSSGKVLVATSGAKNGVMRIDPVGGTLDSALQNVHHPGSFDQPVDVAVLESGGLAVAVVANGSAGNVTLVPLSSITLTPDTAGGGGSALPRVTAGGVIRALAADPTANQVLATWNSGTTGNFQAIAISSNSSGTAGTSIALPGATSDRGIDLNATRREAYIAVGTAGVAVTNADFAVLIKTLSGTPTTVQAVSSTAQDSVLMVGQGTDLSERCP